MRKLRAHELRDPIAFKSRRRPRSGSSGLDLNGRTGRWAQAGSAAARRRCRSSRHLRRRSSRNRDHALPSPVVEAAPMAMRPGPWHRVPEQCEPAPGQPRPTRSGPTGNHVHRIGRQDVRDERGTSVRRSNGGCMRIARSDSASCGRSLVDLRTSPRRQLQQPGGHATASLVRGREAPDPTSVPPSRRAHPANSAERPSRRTDPLLTSCPKPPGCSCRWSGRGRRRSGTNGTRRRSTDACRSQRDAPQPPRVCRRPRTRRSSCPRPGRKCAAVDVPLARLERALDHPHAMQLRSRTRSALRVFLPMMSIVLQRLSPIRTCCTVRTHRACRRASIVASGARCSRPPGRDDHALRPVVDAVVIESGAAYAARAGV